MLNRNEYHPALGLPHEEENQGISAESEIFGPGQLNTYSRFMEDKKDSFIVYTPTTTRTRQYKIIFSNQCLRLFPFNSSILALINAMLAYSEIYLWEGSTRSFATLSPIANEQALWLGLESIVEESKDKIVQSLVQQGYALEEFIILDGEKLLTAVEYVNKKIKSTIPDQEPSTDSIFTFSAPFDFEKMQWVIKYFEMDSQKSKITLNILEPDIKVLKYLRSIPTIRHIKFFIK